MQQIKDAINRGHLQNYDIELMCSVYNKVTKYNVRLRKNEWRTDVRAIRDAVAHAHYKITALGDNFKVEFNNDKAGYNFHYVLTRKDLFKFFDLHTLLYKLQFVLLSIFQLLSILITHFLLLRFD